MGYGDLFVAALLGALLAAQPRARAARRAARRPRRARAHGPLFLVVDELPATVPVAITLLILEAAAWRARRLPG